MLSVDLSNIWCSVSLPDLLQEEKAIFDAHLTLGGGLLKEEGFLSFVTAGETAAMLEKILLLAERVKEHSHVLVVAGGGLTALGVQAAVSLVQKRAEGVELIFCGENYSSHRWHEIASQLENTDFSVLALSSNPRDPAALLSLRSLRRMMEGRYGEKMAERIFVSCPQHGALFETAQAEGYTLLPIPACGGEVSSLNPAGLFLMACAGLDPCRVLTGAAAMAEKCDLRSFENPVWLYVGARLCMLRAGFIGETLLSSHPNMEPLAHWWQKVLCAAAGSAKQQLFVNCLHLPGDIPLLGDAVLAPKRFMTHLDIPLSSPRTPVEMDWKDADGLNALEGKDLGFVAQAARDAALDAFARQDVPVAAIQCQFEPKEKELGALLYFVEFSAALSAMALGERPFSTGDMTLFYRQLAESLGWNSSKM